MILGIIGFIAMIPGLMCASICGAAIEAASAEAQTGHGVGATIIMLTAIPAIAGFIMSFMAKTKAKIAGWVMIISAIILVIPVVMSGNWFFGLITIACYLIGGILAFQNK